jgi:hypothetical protein
MAQHRELRLGGAAWRWFEGAVGRKDRLRQARLIRTEGAFFQALAGVMGWRSGGA